MTIEIQLYIDHFLEARKICHKIRYKIFGSENAELMISDYAVIQHLGKQRRAPQMTSELRTEILEVQYLVCGSWPDVLKNSEFPGFQAVYHFPGGQSLGAGELRLKRTEPTRAQHIQYSSIVQSIV